MKKYADIVLAVVVMLSVLFCVNAFAQDRVDIPSQTILNYGFDLETMGFTVDVQDQTTPPFDLFFSRQTSYPTTLSAVTAIDDTTITVTSATGFVDGTFIGIFSGVSGENRFYFGEQLGAPVGNVITIDSPLDFAFSVGDSVVPLSRELNVDGTTPVTFSIQGPGAGSVDITRIMIKVLCDSAVSLNTFCNLTSLTNGVVLRKTDGETRNIWNVKNTGELAHLAFDLNVYDSTNPQQGQDGFLIRYTFAGQDKHGVAVRLEQGERLDVIIQDPLQALDLFRIMAQGHKTTNE